MPVPSVETLRGMGSVLMDIAAEIESAYPFQANSVRNMATEILTADKVRNLSLVPRRTDGERDRSSR